MPININFLIHILKILDPQIFAPLKKYVGKTGAIHFNDLGYSIFFKIAPNHIILEDNIDNPDVMLSGKTVDLIFLLLSSSKISASVFIKHNISINGQTVILSTLHQAMQQMNIDLEGHLAKLTGDTIAFHIGKTINNTHQWIKNLTHARTRDLTLFLQEEKKVLPTHYELNDFYEAVDALFEATERLEKRIQEQLHGPI